MYCNWPPEKPMEKPHAYSIREIAQALGIGLSTAYRRAHDGELPAIRLGGRLLVPAQAIERLLAGQSKPLTPDSAHGK
jgi:excisionase family DNA binding protein